MNKPASIALVLTLLVAAAVVLPPSRPAWGGTTDARGPVLAVSMTVDANHEMLYLVDTEKHMMCLYDTDHGKDIRLVAVRNLRWDMNEKIIDYPKNGPAPTAEQMKEMFDKKPAEGHGGGTADGPGPH